MKRLIAILLIGMLVLSGCGAQQAAPTPAPTPEPVAGVDFAPDTGTADRSALPYLNAIEGGRKIDWSASWIWTQGCSDDSYMCFRKTFTLDAEPGETTAYISAVDKYVLWVNGELTVLDGSLKRGPTPYDSYYDEVTISNLQTGENTLAVLVAFNGRDGDGSIVPVMTNADGDEENQAGFLFEMQAGSELIVSDNSWKALRSPAYKNRVTAGADYPNYKQSSMLAERNVYYNAQDELAGWQEPAFDDSAWEAAYYIAKPGQLPFGELYAAGTKPVLFDAPADFANAAEYLGKTLSEDTTLVLDLPGNRQFTWLLSLDAPAGKKLTVYTDTYTDTDGTPNFKDTYVSKEGSQSYENYPWRSGSKLIVEAEAGITFTSLQYRLSGYNGEQSGSFTSSDAQLDQLWQESLNTVAICMRDTFMDCPDRERGPYMGDASNQIDALLYSYGEGSFEMIRKAILNCVAWTTSSNAIPSRAPSTKPQEIPNQSLIFMSSAYHYWLASGDNETMTAYYHAFINYLKLFETDENGFVLYRDGSWQWNDWGKNIDAEMLQAGIYAYALKLTQLLANDLGIHEDEAFLTERMAAMQNGWRERYTQDDGFRSAGSKVVDDRANAMLVLSGLAGEEDYPQITDVLANTYEASPFCEKYVLEALCLMGREDLALERILSRYAPMLTDEYDTLWEKFTEDRGTVNHGWTAAPLYILSKYVAGVQPTAAGYESYQIVPSDALDSFTCTVWTPKGDITVIKEGDSITANGPAGGSVIYPDGKTEQVLMPGVTLSKLAVASRPDKTEYLSGETFDPAGLVINAVYSDGSVVENVAYEAITGVIPPKTTVAKVSCMGQELTISVKVITAGNALEYSVENTVAVESSPVAGNVYFWLGSSVTFGAESEGETMADFFAKKWSCTSVKEAVSGTTLSTKAPNSYVERLEKYLNSPGKAEHLDGFICQLSTNDTRYPDDLGIIMPDFITGADAFDTSTTFGAMEYILSKVKETWDCPVYFYTNPPYNNAVYPSMVDGLMRIAEKWNVTVIDLYHDEEFNAITEEQRSLYMTDTVHPTKAGYREWWLPKFEAALIPD